MLKTLFELPRHKRLELLKGNVQKLTQFPQQIIIPLNKAHPVAWPDACNALYGSVDQWSNNNYIYASMYYYNCPEQE